MPEEGEGHFLLTILISCPYFFSIWKTKLYFFINITSFYLVQIFQSSFILIKACFIHFLSNLQLFGIILMTRMLHLCHPKSNRWRQVIISFPFYLTKQQTPFFPKVNDTSCLCYNAFPVMQRRCAR